MLTSQTSSGSATSLPMRKSEAGQECPEKFKQFMILCRKVFYDDPDDCLTVMVTSTCEVIECRGREVVNYINLTSQASSSSFTDCDFEIFTRSSGDVVYALKIHSMLFGVGRSTSQLKLLKVLSNVDEFRVKLDELSSETSVQVTFGDRRQVVTRFQDEDLEEFLCNRDSDRFRNVFICARRRADEACEHLYKLTSEIHRMSLKLHEEQKMMPTLMLDDVSRKFCRQLEQNSHFFIKGLQREVPAAEIRKRLDENPQREARHRRSPDLPQ